MQMLKRNIVKVEDRKFQVKKTGNGYSGPQLGIKRNIVNLHTVNTLASKSNNSGVLKSNGLGKYKYPIYDEVPSNNYFSKIKKVENVILKSGKKALRVYYILKDFIKCHQVVNELVPADTYIEKYYIKQDYPEGTEYYETFLDSMDEALNKGGIGFSKEEIIGVTEYVTLAYGYCDIGGFTRRRPFVYEDFITLYQNSISSYEEFEEDKSVDEHEKPLDDEVIDNVVDNAVDEDTEFDDFYDDFDEEFEDFLPEDEE